MFGWANLIQTAEDIVQTTIVESLLQGKYSVNVHSTHTKIETLKIKINGI